MIARFATTVSLLIKDSSQIGETRRFATAMAGTLGMSATAMGRVSIIATEAATNIVKHAGNGEVLLQRVEDCGEPGLDILSLDRGPGMADLDRCMEDGYSTAGSPGTGLGAMSRLSTMFDIVSKPNFGTAVLCRVLSRQQREAAPATIKVGGVAVPLRGEEMCGDGWTCAEREGRTSIMLADGLGHGQFACEAAEVALTTFDQYSHEGPAAVIERAHGLMRATRGAAVAVIEIDPAAQNVRFAGIGNIAAVILNGDIVRNLMSHNGTVGAEIRKVQEWKYPWLPGSLLVMNSDGVHTQWKLENAPDIRRHHPTLLSALLYRDYRRERDDVMVVSARDSAGA